ncbi:MAG TPA: OmpA family protein [Phycisphaerales bacterium]|nr:OmpA family protein [Phycisphaerales bacterium]
MMTGKGVLRLALVVSIGAALMGCSGNKKKSDMAMQEASELRERNATLDQANRDKDARIAELETKLANCVTTQQQPAWGGGQPATGFPPANEWQPGNDGGAGFVRNDDGNMVATIAGNVLFDSGSATLKSGAKKQLDRIVRELKGNYKGLPVQVEGHTDSDPIRKSKGKWGTNEALSQARADAVKTYLASQGVSSSRIDAVGYGSSKPKSTKAASRRVEIVVMTRG